MKLQTAKEKKRLNKLNSGSKMGHKDESFTFSILSNSDIEVLAKALTNSDDSKR